MVNEDFEKEKNTLEPPNPETALGRIFASLMAKSAILGIYDYYLGYEPSSNLIKAYFDGGADKDEVERLVQMYADSKTSDDITIGVRYYESEYEEKPCYVVELFSEELLSQDKEDAFIPTQASFEGELEVGKDEQEDKENPEHEAEETPEEEELERATGEEDEDEEKEEEETEEGEDMKSEEEKKEESLNERNRDGTGPAGKGPLTGRGMGSCGGTGTLAQRKARLKKKKRKKESFVCPSCGKEQTLDEMLVDEESLLTEDAKFTCTVCGSEYNIGAILTKPGDQTEEPSAQLSEPPGEGPKAGGGSSGGTEGGGEPVGGAEALPAIEPMESVEQKDRITLILEALESGKISTEEAIKSLQEEEKLKWIGYLADFMAKWLGVAGELGLPIDTVADLTKLCCESGALALKSGEIVIEVDKVQPIAIEFLEKLEDKGRVDTDVSTEKVPEPEATEPEIKEIEPEEDLGGDIGVIESAEDEIKDKKEDLKTKVEKILRKFFA